MMSSVAAYACFQVVFIAYCLASSREKTITRSGWPRSPEQQAPHERLAERAGAAGDEDVRALEVPAHATRSVR